MYFNVFEVSCCTANCVYSKDCHVLSGRGLVGLIEGRVEGSEKFFVERITVRPIWKIGQSFISIGFPTIEIKSVIDRDGATCRNNNRLDTQPF